MRGFEQVRKGLKVAGLMLVLLLVLCQNHVSLLVTVDRSLPHDVPSTMKSTADCHIARW